MSQIWNMLDNDPCSEEGGGKGGEEWLGLESDEEQLEKLHREHKIWLYTWKKKQHTVTDVPVAIWHRMK